eukprot:2536074-Rhodomonas_salina.4
MARRSQDKLWLLMSAVWRSRVPRGGPRIALSWLGPATPAELHVSAGHSTCIRPPQTADFTSVAGGWVAARSDSGGLGEKGAVKKSKKFS